VLRLREAALQHRNDAVTKLFAPAAELLLDSVVPLRFPSRSNVLCIEPGGAVLVAAARVHPATSAATLAAVESDRKASRSHAPPTRGGMVVAESLFLPFASRRFNLVLANLVLGDVDLDLARLREMARVLAPGGQLIATALTAGTLEELQMVGRALWRRDILAVERGGLYDPDRLRRLFQAELGLAEVQVSLEERALVFSNGYMFMDNGLMQTAFFPDWLRNAADPRARAAAISALAEALNQSCGGGQCTMRVVTCVVHGKRP